MMPPALRARHVHVLVPTMPSEDTHLQYYGDYEQSRDELRRAFEVLAMPWSWHSVGMDTMTATVHGIAAAAARSPVVVLNLCDGDDAQGVPGRSVIDALEQVGLPYTGATAAFYDATTSKIPMKRAFDAAGVPTAPWRVLSAADADWAAAFPAPGVPLIVKPAISAGSLGIGVDSVVTTPEALADKVHALAAGYHGWDLVGGGVFAEAYVAGPEYTTFIIGDADAPESLRVFPPVERVFHQDLPATERFLSFDRLWEFYDREAPLPNGTYLWEYAPVAPETAARIAALSLDAYVAVGGAGYGRVDLRADASTGALYVLEVNAQCGLSEDENYTSIGAILRVAEVPYAALLHDLLSLAEARHARRTPGRVHVA